MSIIKTENYQIIYNEQILEDLETAKAISKKFDEIIPSLTDFFQLPQPQKNVQVKLYDNLDDFQNYVNQSFEKKYESLKKINPNIQKDTWENWIIGYGGNNRIDMLNISLCKTKTIHTNTTLNDMIKLATHELVHVYHTQALTQHNCPPFLMEGIATQLAEQSYYQLDEIKCTGQDLLENFNIIPDNYHSAYTLMGYMLEHYTHNELLDIITLKKPLNTQDLDNLISQTNQQLTKTHTKQ